MSINPYATSNKPQQLNKHLLLRSANPALSHKTFSVIPKSTDGVMTVDGAINRVAISSGILLLSGYFTFTQRITPFIFIGLIGGLLVALITIVKKHLAPVTVPIYAALEGLALGGISFIFNDLYEGIVFQAIFLTLAILFSLLFAYKSRRIKASENFKLGVVAATGGIFIVYLVGFVMSLFGSGLPIMDINNSSMFSVGFSLFVVLIASLNLVLDFDFIKEGAKMELQSTRNGTVLLACW